MMGVLDRAGMSAQEIRSALNPLADTLTCAQCRMAFRERVSALVVNWATIRVSIHSCFNLSMCEI
jgi:hypothetical protein